MDDVLTHHIPISIQYLLHNFNGLVLSYILLQFDKLTEIPMRTVLSDQEIIDLGLVDIDTTDHIAVVE